MIIAYRLSAPGRIAVLSTRNVDRYIANVNTWSPTAPDVVAVIKAPLPWLQAFRTRFSAQAVVGKAEWFEETPELLAWLEGAAVRDKPPRDRRRRLTDAEAREVFRMAHDPQRLGDEAIGDKYRVSKVSVGLIARGQSHKHLFAQDPAPEAPPGSYWVYEIGNPDKRYLLRFGERKR